MLVSSICFFLLLLRSLFGSVLFFVAHVCVKCIEYQDHMRAFPRNIWHTKYCSTRYTHSLGSYYTANTLDHSRSIFLSPSRSVVIYFFDFRFCFSNIFRIRFGFSSIFVYFCLSTALVHFECCCFAPLAIEFRHRIVLCRRHPLQSLSLQSFFPSSLDSTIASIILCSVPVHKQWQSLLNVSRQQSDTVTGIVTGIVTGV